MSPTARSQADPDTSSNLAAVLDGDGLDPRWAEAIWQGRIHQVLPELQAHQQRLGFPPQDASADDPRLRVARAITYYTNHQSRMNYPEYRRLGLPVTSSLMESTIKQLSQRVKGTEKFWTKSHAEAILQLRADFLSDSQPLPVPTVAASPVLVGLAALAVLLAAAEVLAAAAAAGRATPRSSVALGRVLGTTSARSA